MPAAVPTPKSRTLEAPAMARSSFVVPSTSTGASRAREGTAYTCLAAIVAPSVSFGERGLERVAEMAVGVALQWRRALRVKAGVLIGLSELRGERRFEDPMVLVRHVEALRSDIPHGTED